MKPMSEDQAARYRAAVHAVQSGVEYMKGIQPSQVDPKHLRVGINSAMVETSVLTRLLVAKGIFTEDEHAEMLIAVMLEEAKLYEAMLEAHYGTKVTLA